MLEEIQSLAAPSTESPSLRVQMTATTVPKQVEILGQPFEMILVAAGSSQLPSDKSGLTRISQLEMIVDSSMPKAQLQDTVLHEVLHGIVGLISMLGTEDDAELVEEKLVKHICAPLLHTLRSNPELVAWLMS